MVLFRCVHCYTKLRQRTFPSLLYEHENTSQHMHNPTKCLSVNYCCYYKFWQVELLGKGIIFIYYWKKLIHHFIEN